MNNIKPRDMQVFEILSEISNLPTDDLKTNTLQKKYYDHTPLHRILKMNYCDTIVPMVPDGTPPFNRNDNADGPNHSSLWEYIRLFPVIVRSGQSVRMKPLQIERTFIEMLEAVDANEAEIVCLAKDKKLHTRFEISSDVVKNAFPVLNIVTNQPAEPVVEKTKEEKAADFIELAKAKKAAAKKLYDEAKQYIKKAEELTNENA